MEDGLLQALNFEVKAIETFLGYKFEGETNEDKKLFADKHKEERRAYTSALMEDMYNEYVEETSR
ncbi:hypothetical protein [Sporosarcina sp. FSL W7-1283]|uniref:hypothetical protein n=1 Tax=Sporosarcina sp. FSL W7-1283 TaxID=2921560 RepID=UPI0030F76070